MLDHTSHGLQQSSRERKRAFRHELLAWQVRAAEATGQLHSRSRLGRPSKLTPRVVGDLVMATRAGVSRKDAARFAGVSEATLHRWLHARGRQFDLVRTLLGEAEIAVKIEVTSNLYRLALRETRAALIWLSWRHPEEWGHWRRWV
jgi:hypothetical protein